MTQYLADFGQGSALPQHLASQCMPELMRTLERRINPGAGHRLPDD
jgi:hypothetical protein